MKHPFIAYVLLICSITISQAQIDFGVKGGLNFNSNGDYLNEVKDIEAKNNSGYHVGIYLKTGENLYLRPEFIYIQSKSDYNNSELTISKLDLPIMIGYEAFNFISVFAGPSLQYILDTDASFDTVKLNDLESDFTVGLNVGVAIKYKRVRLDVRYERGFTENEIKLIDGGTDADVGRIDTRAEQIIVGLSYKLF